MTPGLIVWDFFVVGGGAEPNGIINKQNKIRSEISKLSPNTVYSEAPNNVVFCPLWQGLVQTSM